MEHILREYEVRLLDGDGQVILVVPVIAGSEVEARALASRFAAREKAANYVMKPQMGSRGYRAQKPAAPPDN